MLVPERCAWFSINANELAKSLGLPAGSKIILVEESEPYPDKFVILFECPALTLLKKGEMVPFWTPHTDVSPSH